MAPESVGVQPQWPCGPAVPVRPGIRHYTSYLGVAISTAMAAFVAAAAAGDTRNWRCFHAVAVVVSFLAGLTALVVFSYHGHSPGI